MDAGAHIPSYLLCEQLAAQGRVADLFPPDERGARILLKSAGAIVVTQVSSSRFTAGSGDGLLRVVARPDAVPLAKGGFDLVLALAVDKRPTTDDLEAQIRTIRELLRPSGIAAIAVQNPNAADSGARTGTSQPDLLDLERTLRRHFPHVSIFAQQPLHGAVLSPIGRRAATEAPLLDDRLLPDGGELPTHFVALCSPRYHKLIDAIITRLPFNELAEQIRARIDKLEGTVAVVREESEARSRRVAAITAELEQTRIKLVNAEEGMREVGGLRSRVAEGERQLARRDQLLSEAERAREDQRLAAAALDEQLHEAHREARRLERRIADVERERDLALKEREDAERERLSSVDDNHRARADVKAKQRELDDAMEQLAGAETELETLRVEAARQRRDLIGARERVRQLELTIGELESLQTDTSSLEAELQRIRGHAATERERLESRADEEHRDLLEAIAAREEAVRQCRALEVQLQENTAALSETRDKLDNAERELSGYGDRASSAEAERSGALRRIEELEQKVTALKEQRAAANAELDELRRRSLEAEEVAVDLGRVSQDREAEIERQSHALTVLGERAEAAEKLAAELEETGEELRAALAEAEASLLEQDAEFARSRSAADQVALLERNLEEITTSSAARIAELEQALAAATGEARELSEQLERTRGQEAQQRAEIERLRPNAGSAESARQRAIAAEARVAELESIETELRAQISEGAARLADSKVARAELAARLEESERQAEALREQREERGRQLEELRGRLGDAETQVTETATGERTLRDTLEERDARLSTLVQENEELKGLLAEADLRAADAVVSVDRQREEEHAAVRERLKTAEAKLAEVEGSESELRNQLEEAEDRLGALDAERQELDSALAETRARMQRAEIEVARLTDVERELRAHLGDTKGRARRADSRVAELESECETLRHHYEETIKRVAQLESDFQTAMEALAESEEDQQDKSTNAIDRIHAMKTEIRRLRVENEAELLRVREDLEAELRTVNAQLEARQGEIWELTEEVVRLRALTAATAAAGERDGDEDGIRRTLAEQESRIDQLAEERTQLKEQCEQLARSLERRKKNIKILAELFKRERRERLESEPPPPETGWDGAQPRSLITMELNIKQLLAEAGADVSDDLDLLEEEEPSRTDPGSGTDAPTDGESD